MRAVVLILVLLSLAAAGCGDLSGAPAAASTLPPAPAVAVGSATAPPVISPEGQPPASPEGLGRPIPGTEIAESTPTPFPLSSTPSLPPPAPSITPLLATWPASCEQDTCLSSSPLPFARPIVPPGRDTPDKSYPFGSTQSGMRDPHHGVEFLNAHGTPVLAAAEGRVVVAGDDREIYQGPYSYFYGNLVVIQHDLPGAPQPVFTLYGHLSDVVVQEGDAVRAGQEIGKVGMSGVATGSHLHFEVRVGENQYAASRNPALWLAPLNDEAGKPMGALAGRILDAQGNPAEVDTIVVEHLLSPDGPSDWEIYLSTYEEKALLAQPPWEDTFGAGDLPAGWYQVSFIQSGWQRRIVQVLPGQLTLVYFELANR